MHARGLRARGLLWAPDALAAVGLAVVAALYLARLDAWLINDDEGSYLYAAWRIGLGEMPYRDFLTPQLPAFLLPGGAVMRLLGADVTALRALAALATLGAGAAAWSTARRLFGPWVAGLAGLAVLLHPLVFADTRAYRPDPFMLLLTTLGVALFARAALPRPAYRGPPSRAWLAAAGAAFGLALLTKLFGALPLCACAAWLALDARRRGRPARAWAADLAALFTPVALLVAAGMAPFLALTGPGVYDAVLGHHLRQGAGTGTVDVLRKGLGFFAQFVRQDGNGLLAFTALAAALAAWRRGSRSAQLLAWQLPTALAFFLLTRQLFPRHLLYLVPAMATLFAVEVRWLARRPRRATPDWRGGLLAAGLTAGLLVPWAINDWHRSWQWEDGTWRAGDFIQLTTAPDDLVLADTVELNFYGQRQTTYSAASLSEGAARSGQIAWAHSESPQRIADELAARAPALVLVDLATEWSQLAALRDHEAFQAWLDETCGPPVGTLGRHHQRYAVYRPDGRALPELARFAGGPALLAAAPLETEAAPGSTVRLRAAWRADVPMGSELAVRGALLDAAGREWAAGDAGLHASGSGASRVRPTTEWAPGDLTADRVSIGVPVGTPPGDYDVAIGLYERWSLRRLEATAPDGRALGQRVVVGRLRVSPTAGHRRALPPGALARALPEEADANGVVRLLGRGPLPPAAVEAGATLAVDLWWLARRTTADAVARVTLTAADGTTAAVVAAPLGLPDAGSSTWPDEAILVRQPLRLPVPAASATGAYELSVAAPGVDGVAAADTVGHALGTVQVTARDLRGVLLAPPPLERPLEAVFGGVLELLGVRTSQAAPAMVRAGQSVALELVWRAAATPERSYKVSLQLVDEAGRIAAQHDAVPAGWARPTTGWLPGEVVLDRHELLLPDDLAPGPHRLLVVVYDPDSLARLPAAGADTADEAAVLGPVTVGR